MIELIEQTVDKIESLLKETLPESKYQFELFDLKTNTKHFRGLDEPFHWGSVYKLFVVAEICKMIDEGLIKADDELVLHRGRYTHGAGILKFFSHLDRLTFLDACKMVMATSDGLCADELLEIVGFERLNDLFAKANCPNSKLAVNLDTMVKNLFDGIDLSAGADFYLSSEYFEFFDGKLDELLKENYTTVQDLNQGFHFILTDYLSNETRKIFLECVLMPSIHTRIAQYIHLSKFSLQGKTGALGFANANNECVAIIRKSDRIVFGYFALNTKNNRKRNFQSNDTFGLIGLEIAKLYEAIL
ncbi:MAG TPA: serine hydrolase [Pyrinomonadaceae bacterium]|nr:serine hydrolase [Pyrinomonadaceae bacterium]